METQYLIALAIVVVGFFLVVLVSPAGEEQKTRASKKAKLERTNRTFK